MTTSNLFLVCAFLIVGISRASATTERRQLVVIVPLGSGDETDLTVCDGDGDGDEQVVMILVEKRFESYLCLKAADDPLVALLHPHVHVVVGVHLGLGDHISENFS